MVIAEPGRASVPRFFLLGHRHLRPRRHRCCCCCCCSHSRARVCARSSSFLRPLLCSGIDVVREFCTEACVFFSCLFIATQPNACRNESAFFTPEGRACPFFFMANSIRLLYSIHFFFFLSFSSFSLLFLPCLPVCLFYFLALSLFLFSSFFS